MKKSTLVFLATASLTLGSAIQAQAQVNGLTQDPLAAGAAAVTGQPTTAPKPATTSPVIGGTGLAGSVLNGGFNPAVGASPTATGGLGGALDGLGLSGVNDVLGGLNNTLGGLSQGLGDFLNILGLGSIFGDIGNLLGNLPQTAEMILGGGNSKGAAGIPDNQQVSIDLDKPTNAAGRVLAQSLEIRTQEGAYSITPDETQKAQRDAAIGVANSSALNKAAQTKMKERAEAAQKLTEANVELGEDSKKRDTSLQLLQNVSQQAALNSQIDNAVLQEATQARVDRAFGNLLNSQQARELAIANTVDRRQGIASGNTAIQQSGLVFIPGGFYLGSDGKP